MWAYGAFDGVAIVVNTLIDVDILIQANIFRPDIRPTRVE